MNDMGCGFTCLCKAVQRVFLWAFLEDAGLCEARGLGILCTAILNVASIVLALVVLCGIEPVCLTTLTSLTCNLKRDVSACLMIMHTVGLYCSFSFREASSQVILS